MALTRQFRRHACSCLVVSAIALSLPQVRGDEGMWLFNDLPTKQLKEKYGFEPTPEWSNHVMRSSVRFNSGGSASFVSSTGLVLTNHHVGADTLYKVSTPEHNYHRDGFYAKNREDEIKAPDLELNQLISIEDVTDRVNAVIKPEMSAKEAVMARRAAMSEIERSSLEQTKLRSNVVTLFGGARYHLYRYKKYTDVRLVFAPEAAIAFFGGDADNFEYPRYDLDICIFRVYEDGKPAHIEHFLEISKEGVKDGELIFVSGNPGSTQRIYTAGALAYQRDVALPYALNRLRRREVLLQQFGFEGVEQERRARDDLFGVQNSRKALSGRLEGLQDPGFFAKKRQDETALLAKLAQDPKLQPNAEAWKKVEEVCKRRAELIRQTADLSSQLYGIASNIVFLVSEDKKPDGERLREYQKSNRESLLQQLLSPAPIFPDLEQAMLADSLASLAETRGGDEGLVQKALAGKGPGARAAELVGGTTLADVAARKTLIDGGLAAVEASKDPMIQLARQMEPEARRLRGIREEMGEVERQAYAKIADSIFAVQGTGTYPDATFTLRLSYGVIKGYEEAGKTIPPWTTLGGAFAHDKAHGGREPWQLPPRWRDGQSRLNPETPFNSVSTADIIGGNSGSPVINRAGQFVGIIFDGNIQSLTGDFIYSDKESRAVSVDSRAIIETLKKIYDAAALADELGS